MPRVLLDDAAVTDLERIFDHIGRTLKSLQAAARTILRIRESVDDYEEMIRLGVLTEKDPVELIEGRSHRGIGNDPYLALGPVFLSRDAFAARSLLPDGQ